MPLKNTKFKSRVFFRLRLLPASVLWSALLLMSGCSHSGAATDKNKMPQNNDDARVPVAASSPSSSRDALAPSVETADTRPVILAFGDSLTEGYNLPREKAWPSLLQKRLDEKGIAWRVVNAGISGDTSAGGVSRLEYALKPEVKIMILELGANDGLRGLPVAQTRKNLTQMIELAQQRGIRVILAGMETLPNYGEDYTKEFRQIFRDLAKQYKLTLIPFFLQGVAGNRELNLPDNVHPNEKGSEIVLENVWRAVKSELAKPEKK
jgi:acyl-CoA thioesterase-1